jgi:citrate lyase beta subunit
VALDGRLIDAASIRQAQVMVDTADQIQRSLAAR